MPKPTLDGYAGLTLGHPPPPAPLFRIPGIARLHTRVSESTGGETETPSDLGGFPMAIQTGALRDAMAATYADLAVEAALYTTVPGATAGTEVTGGSYARKTLSWSDSGDGVQTATVTFDVPASTTVKGAGVHDESGTYLDGGAVTEQAFASDGTYTLTLTYTQS